MKSLYSKWHPSPQTKLQLPTEARIFSHHITTTSCRWEEEQKEKLMVVILWEIRWLFLIKKFPSYIKRIVQKASTASTQLRSCYNIIFGQCKKFSIFFYFFINPLHLSKATHKCCCIFLHNLDHPDFEWDQYLRGSFSSMKKKEL